MPTVAVTGSSGKLGRAVVAHLADHGYRVVALDRAPDPASRAAAFVRVDLTDTGQVLEALTGVDERARRARRGGAPRGDPGARADDRTRATFANNIAATYNVFSAARRAGIRSVVWASSETVLGLPFDDVRRPTCRSTRSTRRAEQHVLTGQDVGGGDGAAVLPLAARPDDGRAALLQRHGPEDYAQFPAFDADPRLRSWNLWGYIDGRDGAQAVRLGLEHCARGGGGVEVFVIANADTVMSRPAPTWRRRSSPTSP